MGVEWFSKSMNGFITLYETNITLNTVASAFFTDAYSTLIGFDKNDDKLVIKKITKEEYDSNVYMNCEMHPIVIKQSYGRINGKNLIRKICRYKDLDFYNTTMHKFSCIYDEETKSLIINMKEEIK